MQNHIGLLGQTNNIIDQQEDFHIFYDPVDFYMESFSSSYSQPLTYRDFENDDYKDAISQKQPEIFSLSKSIPLQLSYEGF